MGTRRRGARVWLLATVVAASATTGCSYNRFTAQEEAIRASWGEVQNQLLRRNDLVPNLVESVKGITRQEQEVFGEIADSRARLAGARTPQETIDAANAQSAALARLLVIVENYPELRSSESFTRLMDELAGTENRLAVARGRYNENIQSYNTLRRRFPSNITAAIFGFEEYPYFEAPADAQAAPRVDFGPTE